MPNSPVLQTIIRLMRKKAANHYMKKLRPDKEPKRSVKEIVSDTVSAGSSKMDGDES